MRPPCSPNERDAAEGLATALGEDGYAAHVESFEARRSAGPWLASYVALSAAAALLVHPVPLVAAVLGIAAIVLHARDCDGRPLLTRRTCTGVNVVALARHAPSPDLVVVAPLVRRPSRLGDRERRALVVVLQTAMAAVASGGAVAWVAEVEAELLAWVSVAGVVAAAALAGLSLALYRPPPGTDYRQTDACGVLLRLAPLLADRRVWLVATGSPESGTAAVASLLDEHPQELAGAVWLNLVDASEPIVAVSEEGVWRERRADRWLLDAAEEAGAEVRRYRAAPTNATPLLARRRRALTLMVSSGPESLRVALATVHARLGVTADG